MSEPVWSDTPRDKGNVSHCTSHISLVDWCVRLDRFHCIDINIWTNSNIIKWYLKYFWNVSHCTRCQNLSNLTHQGSREMCRIVQDVRTCLIWHTKEPGVPWCIGFDRCHYIHYYFFSFSYSLFLCKTADRSLENLSNPTHKGTREMCRIVQDVRTCLIWHTKEPGKCVGLNRMSGHISLVPLYRIRQVLTSCTIQHISMVPWCVGLDRFWHPVQSDTFPTQRNQGNVSDCTGCQNLSNPTHKGTREMCQIVQDVRTCLIRYTKGPGKCVRLSRMSELHKLHCILLLVILIPTGPNKIVLNFVDSVVRYILHCEIF
jgi:hypothetical protein